MGAEPAVAIAARGEPVGGDTLAEQVSAAHPGADRGAIRRAWAFTVERHRGQKRASGDAYASHPIAVAEILAGLRLDSASVITGLLHDTVEDEVATRAEIDSLFGPEIGRLVDGVTKVGRIRLQSDNVTLQSHGRRHAENFQKFLLALSEDIRVLLVKLADRLHNMRTLRFIGKEEKRRRIARETMEIYAPLADRFGLRRFKDELEDLAFAEIAPGARDMLRGRLDSLHDAEGDLIPIIADELRRALAGEGLDAGVHGRAKEPYSIWRKMEKKHAPFEQIADVVAFRVLVAETPACYRALGIVHGVYSMIPGRFKDYISTPKRNDYRSLHTAVIGPRRRRVEVQIRTHEMHEVAEFGVAAHWFYKMRGSERPPRERGLHRWQRKLKDLARNAADAEELLKHTKLEMYSDQVFCFTPKGELVTLPSGATPVDLAYAVHSEVGDTCIGAKINGRVAPLRTVLKNGDQVEILRASVPAPDPNWESFVVTGKARLYIRRFVRQQEENEHVVLGRKILGKKFLDHGLVFDPDALAPALERCGRPDSRQLCAAVGRSDLDADSVLVAVHPERGAAVEAARRRPGRARRAADPAGAPVPIKGLTHGIAVHMAECCHPLRGDRIVGIGVKGRGVAVHTIDCGVLEGFANAPERWIDLSWESDDAAESVQVGRIVATMSNVPGSLNALTGTIARADVNIVNLRTTDRSPDFFEFEVDIEVGDVRQLTDIVTELRANPAFFQVERERG